MFSAPQWGPVLRTVTFKALNVANPTHSRFNEFTFKTTHYTIGVATFSFQGGGGRLEIRHLIISHTGEEK